jgi:dihydrofolate reductase
VRRLKVQVQASADGYMGGSNGQVEWAVVPWSDDMVAYAESIQRDVRCILLGRRLAEGFIPTWAGSPEGEDPASVEFMNNTPRVVVSNTLINSPWPNATIADGDLDAIVKSLRETASGDIIAYGGRRLVSDLLARRLVDELHLMVNPVAIGGGLPVFPQGRREPLELMDVNRFDCGVTAVHYRCR